MSDLQQKGRLAELKTPLGENKVVLQRFNGHEALSELFEFTVEALSLDEDIDFDPAIGKNCCVTINSYNGIKRYFNGILVESEWTGLQDALYSYRLVLRPWLWVLAQTTDCRFFQEMTAPDIIKQVFDKAGFSDYELVLTGSYPTMEYCVQYRETHFAFVSRLMEEHGIYYFFKHSEDKHTLVLADSIGAHKPVPPAGGVIPLIPLTGGFTREEEHFQHWTSERRFRAGHFTVNDYDFEKPDASMVADTEASEKYARSKMEIYDYPGRYKERDKGETFAKVRLAAEQSFDHRRIGTGIAPSIYPGGKVKLKSHVSDSENQEFLALRATHSVTSQSYRSGGASSGEDYTGNYVFLPSSTVFRAPLVTPKPLIHGIQTAKVVGESGEEITVDKYGRIKVQFHWDRDKKQSCWIRVAEMWSGKQWGSVFHPRHDQEVVVEFLEGDPDRPLVVGTVYNANNMVPYPLPDKKTIGGFKTNSTKGGGGYNEFILDDKKGSEEIHMHGEKDHNVVIRHAETWDIGETFSPPKGSPSRDVKIQNGDDNLTIQMGDNNITISLGDQNITISAGSQTVQITKNQSTTVVMNKSETVGMSRSATIAMSDATNVAMSRSATIGMSEAVSAAMAITHTAGVSMTMTGGGGIVSLSPAGVTVTGATINLIGAVNIVGALTVDGLIPMLLPA